MTESNSPHYSISPGAGLIRPAVQCPSPNQDDRPNGIEPDLIIIHGISLPPGEFDGDNIQAFFTNCLDSSAHPYYAEIEGVQVSSHLLLRRNGEVIQFVPFGRRAWHAGESSFRGRSACNDYSIGIELEGTDDIPYSDKQYLHLSSVIASICDSYPQITSRQIAGHCDVAPGRKTDPGPVFDWSRLYDDLGTGAS